MSSADLMPALLAHCARAQEPWSDDFKATRRLTLGSSEIAAVCGVNPYASLHNVWLSKVRGVDFVGNEATLLGQIVEPVVVALYASRYGVQVVKGEYAIGPEPWMSATPDYRIVGGGLVEAKLVGLRSMWMWGTGNYDGHESDAVPLHYLSQCQWQMLVTGETFVHLSALMGTELRTYTIRANADVQRSLVERGRDFWQRYVLTGIEPPADGSEGAREMLKTLYPRSEAEPVEANSELETLAATLLTARETLDRAEYQKREAENKIKQLLQGASGARGAEWRIRYATTKAGKRPFVFEHNREKEGKAA